MATKKAATKKAAPKNTRPKAQPAVPAHVAVVAREVSQDPAAAAGDLFAPGHEAGHVHPTLHAVERLEGLRNPKTTDARLRELLQDAHDRLETMTTAVSDAETVSDTAAEEYEEVKEKVALLEAQIAEFKASSATEIAELKHAGVMELADALARAEKAEGTLKRMASPIGPEAHAERREAALVETKAAVLGLQSDLTVARSELVDMRSTLARERELAGGQTRRAVDAETRAVAAEARAEKAEKALDCGVVSGDIAVDASGAGSDAEFNEIDDARRRAEARASAAEKRAAELREVEPLATAFAVLSAVNYVWAKLPEEHWLIVTTARKLLGLVVLE